MMIHACSMYTVPKKKERKKGKKQAPTGEAVTAIHRLSSMSHDQTRIDRYVGTIRFSIRYGYDSSGLKIAVVVYREEIGRFLLCR